MKDFGLYGHLVFDTIWDTKVHHDIGGIANVWKALKQINPKADIHVSPTNIGYSTITIDREKSDRISNSDLNATEVLPTIIDAKVNHIAYLNEIKNPFFIRHLTGIVCADICTGNSLDDELLDMIDVLFVSEEDLRLIKTPARIKGLIVVHSPKKSYFFHNKYGCIGEYVNGLYVLGAGDYFAAKFMSSMLNNSIPERCLKDAHNATTKFLKERNEKT